MLMDFNFSLKCACGHASHPWVWMTQDYVQAYRKYSSGGHAITAVHEFKVTHYVTARMTIYLGNPEQLSKEVPQNVLITPTKCTGKISLVMFQLCWTPIFIIISSTVLFKYFCSSQWANVSTSTTLTWFIIKIFGIFRLNFLWLRNTRMTVKFATIPTEAMVLWMIRILTWIEMLDPEVIVANVPFSRNCDEMNWVFHWQMSTSDILSEDFTPIYYRCLIIVDLTKMKLFAWRMNLGEKNFESSWHN